MTNLQTLEKRIREAVPSLQELSFGCAIKRGLTEGGDFKCSVLAVEGSMVLSSYAPYQKNYEGRHYDNIQHIETLGHPIQLHYALQAVGIRGHHFRNHSISKDALSFEYINTGVLVQWNLTKDLSGQSEETVNFLLEILR